MQTLSERPSAEGSFVSDSTVGELPKLTAYLGLKSSILKIFTILGGITIAVFGTINVMQGRLFVGLVEWSAVPQAVIVFYLLTVKKNVRLLSYWFVAYMFVVFAYIFYTGGISKTGPLWLFFFPIVCFFFLGSRAGLVTFALFASILTTIVGISHANGDLPYGPIFVALFLSSLSLEATFLFFYERSRERAESTIAGYLQHVENLNLRLQELSDHDELTGLFNRRRIMRRLTEESTRTERYGRPYALLLIDMDYFKQVNDTHGHAIGDRVLCQFADLVHRECLRESDNMGRFGGEEFMVLLPETNEAGAQAVSERILNKVRQFRFGDDADLQLTVSIGSHTVHHVESPQLSIQKADEALYEAKHGGRDQAVTTGQESTTVGSSRQ